MFSEEKLSQAGQQINKVMIKNHFTLTHLMVLNIKKHLCKLSTKIFIKSREEQEKPRLNECF